MDSIKAQAAREASAALRKVQAGITSVARAVSRLYFGIDLVPCATLALQGMGHADFAPVRFADFGRTIFHATNRLKGVFFTHVHAPSLSLR